MKDLTFNQLANNIADIKEHLLDERCKGVIYEGSLFITSPEELKEVIGNKIINDLFNAADEIIEEHKREKMRKTHSSEIIKEDFKELLKEIELANKKDPEDAFLKDILNCVKKGGF